MGDHSYRTGSHGLVDLLSDSTTRFWIIAILFFGLGDLITTGIGLSFPQIVEGGPLTSIAIEQYGLGAMIPLKLLTVVVAYVLWHITPSPHDVGVPLGLAAVGVLVTPWNLGLLLLLL